MEANNSESNDMYVHLIGRAKVEIIGADQKPIDQNTAPEKLRLTLFDSENKPYPITFVGGLQFENIHLIAEFKNATTDYDEALKNVNLNCLVKFGQVKDKELACMNTIPPPNCNTVAPITP